MATIIHRKTCYVCCCNLLFFSSIFFCLFLFQQNNFMRNMSFVLGFVCVLEFFFLSLYCRVVCCCRRFCCCSPCVSFLFLIHRFSVLEYCITYFYGFSCDIAVWCGVDVRVRDMVRSLNRSRGGGRMQETSYYCRILVLY